MPRTQRKDLIRKCDQALTALSHLDEYLFEMKLIDTGNRQKAIPEFEETLVMGHDGLRRIWQALRDRL